MIRIRHKKKKTYKKEQFWVLVVLILILLGFLFTVSHITQKKQNGAEPFPSMRAENITYELIETELELLEKRIERDLLMEELEKLVGKEELNKLLEKRQFESYLSDWTMRDLYSIEVDSSLSKEENLKLFFEYLRKNEERLLKSKQKLSLLISKDGALPFDDLVKKQKESVPLYIGGGAKKGQPEDIVRENPVIPVYESRGVMPIASKHNVLMVFIKDVIKIGLEIVGFIVANKEVFMIVGIFLGLLISLIIVYSMHFR